MAGITKKTLFRCTNKQHLLAYVIMATFVGYILIYSVMIRPGEIIASLNPSEETEDQAATPTVHSSLDRVENKPHSLQLDMKRALWGLELEKPPSYLSDLKNPCWSGSLYCLPYFYQLGVTKCGTSTMFRNLIAHPQIWPGFAKEMNYWANPRKRGGLMDYARNISVAFHTASQADISTDFRKYITLDATPSYFTTQGNLSRISGNWDSLRQEPIYTLAHTLYALNPKTKLLVLLRNPTDRLFSHYNFGNKENFSAQDFHNRVIVSLKAMTNCLSTRSERSCAFDPVFVKMNYQPTSTHLQYSMYYPYAVEWLSVFPRDQMKFVKSEDWYGNPTKVISEIFDFLEVDDPGQHVYDQIELYMSHFNRNISKNSSRTVNNARSYHDAMFPETRHMLNEFFKPFNVKLAKLLGDDSFLFNS